MVVQQPATYIWLCTKHVEYSNVQLQWLGSSLRPQISTISSISKRILFL